MIKVVYYWCEMREVWSDDERDIDGYDIVKEGITEREFKTQEEVDEFIGELSVQEGESEGHESYTILVVYDKENCWYDKAYTNKRGM